MIFNMYSGKKLKHASIVIHSRTGTSVTCTNGKTSYSSVTVDDKHTFFVPKIGSWTIVATYNGTSTTQSIIIPQMDTYDVYFYFCSVNVVSNDTSKGTVSGTTSFTYLKKVSSQTINITTTLNPSSGYMFDEYTTSVGSISGTILTIPANTSTDITVTANFDISSVIVNVTLKRNDVIQSGETVFAVCDGQTTQTRITGSNGKCRFKGLAAGTWTFSTSNTSYVCTSVSMDCIIGGTYNIELAQISAKRVGGTIFYIDSTSTGGTYRFFDQSGVEMFDVAVGDTPYYYSVSGTPSKDKYYIAEQKSVVKACTDGASGAVRKYQTISKYRFCMWAGNGGDSFDSSKIDVFSSATEIGAIGTGRRNTNYINSNYNTERYFPSHNSVEVMVTCWDHAKFCNEDKVNGCDDWFVPSIAECKALYNSGIWGSGYSEWVETTKHHLYYSYLLSSSASSNTAKAWEWYVIDYNYEAYASEENRYRESNVNFLAAIRAF